jgi:hypothetical protein
VVLVIPIVLFLLDLPRPKKPKAVVLVDMTRETKFSSAVLGSGFNPMGQLTLVAGYYFDDIDPSETVHGVEFKELEQFAFFEKTRDYWSGKVVEVMGQFVPNTGSDRHFVLVRFKIGCCAADAQQLNVSMHCKEPIVGIEPEKWVKVKGRVEFHERPDGGPGYVTVLKIPRKEFVQKINPPASFYVQ